MQISTSLCALDFTVKTKSVLKVITESLSSECDKFPCPHRCHFQQKQKENSLLNLSITFFIRNLWSWKVMNKIEENNVSRKSSDTRWLCSQSSVFWFHEKLRLMSWSNKSEIIYLTNLISAPVAAIPIHLRVMIIHMSWFSHMNLMYFINFSTWGLQLAVKLEPSISLQ